MRHIFWKVYSTDMDADKFCEKSEYFFHNKEKALELVRSLIGKKIPSIPEEEPFLSLLSNPRRLFMKTSLVDIEVNETEDSLTFEAIYDAEFYEMVTNTDEGIAHVDMGWAEVALMPQNGNLKCLGNLYIKDQYLDEVQTSFSPRKGYERWYAVRRIDISREVIDTED